MYTLGIDIGTTTICAIAVESATGAVVKTVTEANSSALPGRTEFERLQDPKQIWKQAAGIVQSLISLGTIDAIGISGQMHGILYCDKNGLAVSPLYTWQDESGNQKKDENRSYSQQLSGITGYPAASGYGLTTAFYHACNNQFPQDAASLCTIGDYIAMRLTGKARPCMHVSNAASLGLFSRASMQFDTGALRAAGIPLTLLPEVVADCHNMGCTAEGIPVAVALGDNQASYIGSTCNMEDCLLVNVGTGSQISWICAKQTEATPDGLEYRPCTGSTFLAVGASLCGGRAFSALERFFARTAELVTGQTGLTAYAGMDKRLQALEGFQTNLQVNTQFCGSRKDPTRRGTIENIDLNSLTPDDLIFGFMNGMIDELYALYRDADPSIRSGCRQLIGSGNGLRRNPTLQRLFEEKFGMTMRIPKHKEEASFGAVLFALVACGKLPTMAQAQQLVQYK